ncbi:LOW QUALITY PROTEIN: trifunctional purine biosynthetic protein adenosine-3-like [Homalodisca vitripennis]|uniref:LOW QUALITY PROTEIN: trifunctional purine biosynthetic protein adenosine-3-like n=1 Tax=Homalodisca vitripennis TaxID=197043 RepID=UPI001EECC1C4|nr:LOW QUALITY PROTEIN: trifunctional purine biosynthetic protein adenosine-3-like [Homalodisca vitripennis]
MLVVKATGLAAGKGVVVAESRDEVCAAIEEALVNNKFGTAGNTVIVEERLEGHEVSVLGFCDGRTVKAMVPAQDHKRALNGDLGPNTGGMGAYAPCLLLSPRALKSVEENILQRAVKGLSEEGCPFVGVLYAGLMMTRTGPKVLEFNCRFGDPETEVLLPLLESDLYEIMLACCEGRLEEQNIEWEKNMSVVAVIMASKGYPESSSKGDVIEGVKDVMESSGTQVFHCGTGMVDGKLVTAGGRVLAVVSKSESLSMTATLATAACQRIHFPGAQFRTDIAHKGIPRWILKRGKLTYKASGVDIAAGDALVSTIKPAVAATSRAGVMGQLGGFAAAFDLKEAGYEDPILVSGTDGVGTKLKIAQECGQYSSLGQDLVAMCVNDVLCQGAAPLFFLDYFACGHLAVNVAGEFINGVAEACNLAGCALVGGETAEMPGLYKDGDFDVAGFVVGAVERKHLLPRVSEISAGDVVIGVPSSGLHSNGFSLVRRVMDLHGLSYDSPSPFSDKTLGEELLTPTKIYVKDVMPFIDKVKAIAHITGGGLVENIPRVLPSDVSVRLDASHWPLPPVFGWLAVAGGVGKKELLRTFNCGIGLVLICRPEICGGCFAVGYQTL